MSTIEREVQVEDLQPQLHEPGTGTGANFAWSPQPGPQADAIAATWCDELFFGGARGGGKSAFLLGDFLQDVYRYGKNWRGVIFRRTYDELEELLSQAYDFYPQSGGTWVAGKRQWEWPTGSTLKFRFLEREEDATRYQGHQYVWIAFDELTNWPNALAYDKLKACLRSPRKIDTKRIRATGNPGGSGHGWVKQRFVDPEPKGFVPIEDPESKMTRMFVPSKIKDNQILLNADPQYVNRLKSVGSEGLIKAWLDGDWNALVGAYFSEEIPVISDFEIPWHWMRFGCFDWGSYAPFVFQWVAVSDGTVPGIPHDALVVYREFYGAKSPNVGLKWPASKVAQTIMDMTASHEKLSYSVADPSIFKQDGGVSIAEAMRKEGLNFRPGDNSRIAGWNELRARLNGNEGKPMIFFTGSCTHTVRTLRGLVHDPVKPEDIDTRGDDHAADSLRYGLMSRPFTLKMKHKAAKMTSLQDVTFNDMIKEQGRVRNLSRKSKRRI